MNGPIRRAGVVLALALGLVARAPAMDVVRLDEDQLVERADCIVHGTVIDVAAGRDADGIPATWITVDVAECLKGHADRRLVWKQLGVPEPQPDGTLLRVPGLPRYRVDDEVVLFLHQPSGRGFTSPVGLGQGLYRVETRAAGRFVRSAAARHTPEALPAFLDRVRTRAQR